MEVVKPMDTAFHETADPVVQSTTRSKRRRLLMGLVLVVIAFIVIRWFAARPLSDVEQRLVGTWSNVEAGIVFTLTEDRAFVRDGKQHGGSYYVEGERMYMPDPMFSEFLSTLQNAILLRRRNPDFSYVISIEDDDHVTVFIPINDSTYHWERRE